MWKKTGTIALFMFLFAGMAFAEDTNASGEPSPEELQQMILDLRNEIQLVRSQAVTVRMDEDTRQLLAILEDKIINMEQRLDQIDQRLLTMKSALVDKIDSSQAGTVSLLEAAINKRVGEAVAELKEYTRMMTNPIRINLPNFGLWLMLTAAFMLFAGLRYKVAVVAAEREKRDNKNIEKTISEAGK